MPTIDSNYINTFGINFVLIKPGIFSMGSSVQEPNWYHNEFPLHEVSIDKPFYMGKYTITQDQWFDIMNYITLSTSGDIPVTKITWSEVKEFINCLNEKENTNKYRLPSEAEWEYCCKGGTNTKYSFGDDIYEIEQYAWYNNNSVSACPVGLKKANLFGLYDMHGNVWEWMEDAYHDTYKNSPLNGNACEIDSIKYPNFHVLRGGSWISSPAACRSTSRYFYPRNGRRSTRIGFRLVKDI